MAYGIGARDLVDPWPRGHWMMIHQISNLTLQIDCYPAGYYLLDDFT